MSDVLAAERLANLLKALPEDSLEQTLRQTRSVPEPWRQCPLAELVRGLRRRFDMTQRQLAALSGLSHSKVAKIEGGQDIQVGTLRQLFAGFGCALVILPVSRLSAEQLWRRTQALCEEGHIRRRRPLSKKVAQSVLERLCHPLRWRSLIHEHCVDSRASIVKKRGLKTIFEHPEAQ